MAADACASLRESKPSCASLSGKGASCAGRHADAADDRGPNQAPRCLERRRSPSAPRLRARVCVCLVVYSFRYCFQCLLYLFVSLVVCVCVCWSIGAVVSEVCVFVCALRVRRDRVLRAVPLQRPSSAVALAGACKRVAVQRALRIAPRPRARPSSGIDGRSPSALLTRLVVALHICGSISCCM